MSLDEAILILRNAVKHTGTIDQKHIDLTLVPATDRARYEQALMVTQMAVKDGILTRDDLFARLLLN